MIDRMSIMIERDGKTYAIDTGKFLGGFEMVLELIATALPVEQKLKAYELSGEYKWESASKPDLVECSICHKHTKPSDIENNAKEQPVCLSCWNGELFI